MGYCVTQHIVTQKEKEERDQCFFSQGFIWYSLAVVSKYNLFILVQSMLNALMVNFDFLRKDLIADRAFHTEVFSIDKIFRWKIREYKYGKYGVQYM